MAYGGFINGRRTGMSRLMRDGTAEPVSRDQILRHARGQWNIIFPVQLTTSRIGNLTRLIHTLLYVMTIHTYIHTRQRVTRLPELLGRPAGAIIFILEKKKWFSFKVVKFLPAFVFSFTVLEVCP